MGGALLFSGTLFFGGTFILSFTSNFVSSFVSSFIFRLRRGVLLSSLSEDDDDGLEDEDDAIMSL